MLVLTCNVGQEIVIPSLDVSVGVSSVKGRRVRLRVSAPSEVPVHRAEVWSRITAEPRQSAQNLPIRGKRVLLAEGDTALAGRYQSLLSQLGYAVAIAADAMSCVSCLRRRTPDVLVLDTGLLWGRAEGVLALMEEQDDLAAIPVLVSHQGGRPAWSIRRRIGVCEYAAKPLTPEQLAARIRELVPFQVDDYFPGGIYDDSNLDS